ncbi:hypothetical protein ABPG77_000666 [Micractinium sp. CCAP 211/92]
MAHMFASNCMNACRAFVNSASVASSKCVLKYVKQLSRCSMVLHGSAFQHGNPLGVCWGCVCLCGARLLDASAPTAAGRGVGLPCYMGTWDVKFSPSTPVC